MTLEALRGLFIEERARFAAVLPRAANATLTIKPRPPGAELRDYGYVVGDYRVVLFQETQQLPVANVVGIIRHELGHVCDPYDDDESEERADDIAHVVTGEPIRYDRRGVQTVGRGGKRPKWLLC